MALDRIILANFRNHRETALDGTARFNLLVGENGAGKTNVLEAISLLAPGRGLRRAQLLQMASDTGPGFFALSGDLRASDGWSVSAPRSRPNGPIAGWCKSTGPRPPRCASPNGSSIGWLTPAMDRLFAEGAGGRRRFLDRLVLAIEPAHARNAAKLEAALRERNRLLAEATEPDPAWLDAIEAQIAAVGALVAEARAALVSTAGCGACGAARSPLRPPCPRLCGGRPAGEAELAAALRDQRRRDRAAQRTLTGPHRDDLAVTMASKDQPAAECSTGEQKAMLLALVLAHSGLLDQARPRLLLLDEVAAHLDPLRREALFERLREGQAQVWLTGTEMAPFAAIASEAAVWRVSDGAVERVS